MSKSAAPCGDGKIPAEAEWQEYPGQFRSPGTNERLGRARRRDRKPQIPRPQSGAPADGVGVSNVGAMVSRRAPPWTTNRIARTAEYERGAIAPRGSQAAQNSLHHSWRRAQPDYNGLFAVRRTAATADKTEWTSTMRWGRSDGRYSNRKLDGVHRRGNP